MRPNLPFKIISYHLNRNLDSFEIHLLWNELPISLLGPLQVRVLGKEGLSIQYTPSLQIDHASPLSLKLTSEVSTRLQLIDGVHLEIPLQDFSWSLYGIVLKDFALRLEFNQNALEASAQAKSFAWTEAKVSDHALNLSQSELKLRLPNVHIPTQGNLFLQAQSGEALWGKLYADLKLSQFPLQIDSLDRENVSIKLGEKHEFESKIKPVWEGPKIKSAKGEWKLRLLELPKLAPWLIKTFSSVTPSLQPWTDLQIKSAKGFASGKLNFDSAQSHFSLDELRVNLSEIDLRSLSHHFSTHHLSTSFQYRARESRHHALIQADQLFYKHFEGSLGRSDFSWSARDFKFADPLLLQVKGVEAKLGGVMGTLRPEFDLTTRLKIESTDVQAFTNGLCLPSKKFPPASLKADFPNLEFSSSRIDPTGGLEVDLFKGKIVLKDLGYYDLDTEVPELDFDATFSGIDLQAMSDWSKFGEIQGTLEGYAHQVVFQSSLPTQYHFLLQVMPLDRDHDSARVDFSPEAMKNVVKIFTGTSLDEQMPGIAGWLMFGWPSHVFGGYDVNYAGIKLTSEEGRIVVETLDKPSIFERERTHYVLYGPRFKMPLRNPNYPLFIDATSMNNFVHQLMLQLSSIKKKKEGNKEDEDSPIICDPPEL